MLNGDTGEFVRGLRSLRDLDVSSLVFETVESTVLHEAHADVDRLIRRLTAAKVAMAGVLDARRVRPTPPHPDAPSGGPTPPPPAPPPDTKASRRDARIGRALADLPHTRAAFERGDLTVEQVNAVVRLDGEAQLRDALRRDEHRLIDAVTAAGPDRTGDVIREWRARQSREQAMRDAKARHRARSVRTWRDEDGFHHLHFRAADGMGSATMAWFRELLEADFTRRSTRPGDGPIDERTREQRSADVLTNALSTAVSALADGQVRPRPRSTLLVKIDHADLVEGLGGTDLAHDDPLNAADIRQMCCDAGIARIVTKGASVVLDKGREARLATPQQRQALAAIHDSCAEPGCRTPVWACEIHHLDEFVAEHGETNLDDLVPLCPVSHRRCHHDGHAIERGDRPGELTWVTPDGTRHRIAPRNSISLRPLATTAADGHLGFAV